MTLHLLMSFDNYFAVQVKDVVRLKAPLEGWFQVFERVLGSSKLSQPPQWSSNLRTVTADFYPTHEGELFVKEDDLVVQVIADAFGKFPWLFLHKPYLVFCGCSERLQLLDVESDDWLLTRHAVTLAVGFIPRSITILLSAKQGKESQKLEAPGASVDFHVADCQHESEPTDLETLLDASEPSHVPSIVHTADEATHYETEIVMKPPCGGMEETNCLVAVNSSAAYDSVHEIESLAAAAADSKQGSTKKTVDPRPAHILTTFLQMVRFTILVSAGHESNTELCGTRVFTYIYSPCL